MGKATSSRPRNLRRALRDSAPPLSPPRSSCSPPSPPSPPSSFRKFIRVPEKIENEGKERRDDQEDRSRSDALEEVIIYLTTRGLPTMNDSGTECVTV